MNNKEKIIKIEEAVLGGGCFWCLETPFNRLRGVLSVTSGYAGGQKQDPTYEEVCTGKTGHAEVVKIAFDPAVISYKTILEVFFSLHDPTTLNRQGNDVGTQYRSAIFYVGDAQQKTALKVVKEMEDAKTYASKIVTEIVPLNHFYPAEEYHQKYFAKNPEAAYCQLGIEPKLAKLREKFKALYK